MTLNRKKTIKEIDKHYRKCYNDYRKKKTEVTEYQKKIFRIIPPAGLHQSALKREM